ncbi:MAG TPA: DMT family transporter [Rhizobiaceae bacterium]|nr:DMT family transporter [Rhizobiaceae bacterium]
MNTGVLLALLAYAVFAWGDGIIKGLSGSVGVFGIGFYTTLFAGFFLLFMKPRDERWRDTWRMTRPWAVHGRAIGGLLAQICGIYAFTTIPLAETYALIFVAPFFVTILSVVLLGEDVGRWRWAAVVAGFVGVLLVVKPGFRELQLGHLAALTVALLAAGTMILLRTLALQEKRTTVLATLIAYGVVVNGALMLAFGESTPALEPLGAMVVIGVFIAAGHSIMFSAARRAPAAHIAPTHYSQILWAVIIGAGFFAEYPDWISFVGLAVIAASGLLTLVREKIRLGTVRWNPLRNRL